MARTGRGALWVLRVLAGVGLLVVLVVGVLVLGGEKDPAKRAVVCMGLGLIVIWQRARLPRSVAGWGHLSVVGMTNIVIPYVLITWGELAISSGMAGILTAMVPLLSVVLASVVLHDEPITVGRVAGDHGARRARAKSRHSGLTPGSGSDPREDRCAPTPIGSRRTASIGR